LSARIVSNGQVKLRLRVLGHAHRISGRRTRHRGLVVPKINASVQNLRRLEETEAFEASSLQQKTATSLDEITWQGRSHELIEPERTELEAEA